MVVNDDLQLRYELSTPIPAAQAALWAGLAGEMTSLAGDISRTALIVTDDFPGVVTALEQQVPWSFGGEDRESVSYDPNKADGAQAAGKTLQLPESAVIVVNSRVADLGPASSRRLIHHEARHARMRHSGDLAWAMHRRHPFSRPAGFVFQYVYLAQTLMDEYRCEAALAFEVATADSAMTPMPRQWAPVEAIFTDVRILYERTGDLAAAFAQFLAGLDRIASFAGYAAAAISRGEQQRKHWAAAEPVLLAADALAPMPTADETMTPSELAAMVGTLVKAYGHITASLGFRVEVDERTDMMSFYLT